MLYTFVWRGLVHECVVHEYGGAWYRGVIYTCMEGLGTGVCCTPSCEGAWYRGVIYTCVEGLGTGV